MMDTQPLKVRVLSFPLSNARTMLAEHSYPSPTRNQLSMHNREAAKRKVGRSTKASEVRIGIRTPDGNTYMGTTASEDAKRRQDELLDKALERQQRKAKLIADVHAQMAETDSWAHKS